MGLSSLNQKTGAGQKTGSRFSLAARCWRLAAPLLILASVQACSVLATRPTQEMSDAAAALRAAREVQADTLAPELYRQASEWFFKAKKEYKFKNFALAGTYVEKA